MHTANDTFGKEKMKVINILQFKVVRMLCAVTMLNFCIVPSLSAQEQSQQTTVEGKLVPEYSDITFREIESNGIRMRLAEKGQGPMVLLLHGWPESWYSWRHQINALAAAGYHAVAPDMPGYGETGKFAGIEEYNIVNLSRTMIGILDALGESKVALVAHDWGAGVAWNTALTYPERFSKLIIMSVPLRAYSSEPPTTILKHTFGENFYYQLYFQEPGVAEAEFDNNPEAIISRLYASPDTPRQPAELTDRRMAAGGWIPRLGALKELPAWLTQDDLDYVVAQFKHAGFAGGINYYRNFDRNWEMTPHLANAQIQSPTLFIAGEKDVVIRGADKEALWSLMKPRIPLLDRIELIPDVGHWVQQEAADQVNALMLDFLNQ